MIDQRISDSDVSNCKRDVPSFIEPRPPLISNPFMRPKPQKGTNLLDLFETDSETDEPELVQVYLRLKPCNTPSNLYEVKSDQCLVTSLDTSTVGHGRRTQYNVSKMYTFSHIFGPEANQTELFERVVKDNLKKLPEGHSFTLLTYGASGSGKTFTLMGTVSSPGLVPRSLEYVFRVVDAAVRPVYKPADNGAEKLSHASQEHELQFVKQLRQVSVPLRDRYRRMSTKLHSDFASSNLDLTNRIKYYVWVSFVEIYNEGIYDLLSTNDRSTASKLVIREDSNGNVYVKGATQVFVRTGEEAYDVMVAGKHNLQVAATGVNARSSRSHCIFTITTLAEAGAGCRVSSVRLCDLAGCERARRTRNAGARLAESRAINSSLHVLERCLRTLRQRQRARTDTIVPYRESKLTRLLGAGLSGARGEAVSVVVTVNPAPDCALETRHVLQLAAVARDIQVNNTASEYSTLEASAQDTMLSQSSSASSAELQRLRAENERLHFELIQAQEYSKELAMSMEEQQARNASNMKAVFSEGQHITRQHYETLMRALRQEMEEMKEEYEEKISKLTSQAPADCSPTRVLKNNVSDLMTEIDNLEAKLAAEVSAREGAEQEVCKLRAYIEEMEEKASSCAQNKYEEVISLTESEDDSEEDPCNESLEPVIRKERTRLLRQSLASFSNVLNESIEVAANATSDTNTSEVDEGICKEDIENDIENNEVTSEFQDEKSSEDNVKSFGSTDRGMYLISEPEILLSSSKTVEEKYNKRIRETYFVRKSQDDSKTDESSEQEQDKDESETNIDKETELNEEKGNELTLPMCDSPVKLEENLNLNKSSHVTNKEVNVSKDEVESDQEINDDLRENVNESVPLKKSDSLAKSLDDSNLEESLQNEKESLQNEKAIANNIENEIGQETQIETNEGKATTSVPTATNNLVNKIFKKLKSNSGEYSSNNSLAQFEQLEMEANDVSLDLKRKTFDVLSNINMFKEKKQFFDVTIPEKPENLNCDESNDEKKDCNDVNLFETEKSDKLSHIKNLHHLKNDEFRSPSIVTEDFVSNFEPSTIKKLLGESITRQLDSVPTLKSKNFNKKHDSVDPFDDMDSPYKAVETVEKSFHEMNLSKSNECDVKSNPAPDTLEQKSDIKKPLTEETSILSAAIEKETKVDNTLDAFENIYKDISQPRATDFELLVAQEESSCNKEVNKERTNTQEVTQEATEVKYNLRKKFTSKNDDSDKTNEIVARAKRNLRLRRHKKQMEDETTELEDGAKLKDIINLQVQFSDVTLGKPAPEPPARPASPDQKGEENLPPLGIQSCPSKSVTRSRRKLFTPRAEPLEDESGPCGESGERLRVPRPSYHRPRARRKL